MSARVLVGVLGFILWATLISLTIFDIFANGPSGLALFSLVFTGVLGVGIFGALGDWRSGRR